MKHPKISLSPSLCATHTHTHTHTSLTHLTKQTLRLIRHTSQVDSIRVTVRCERGEKKTMPENRFGGMSQLSPDAAVTTSQRNLFCRLTQPERESKHWSTA